MSLTFVLIAGALAGVGLLALVLLLDDRPARGPAGLARLDLDRRRFRREAVLEVDALHASESMRLRRIGAGSEKRWRHAAYGCRPVCKPTSP